MTETAQVQVYEIVNWSDSYTIKGPFLSCAVGTLLLGEGNYPLSDEQGKVVLLSFLTEVGINDWLREHTGADSADALGEYINANRMAIADVLDTVLIGSRNEYEALVVAVPDNKRDAFREQWHDKHRSSLNDIGKRAQVIAARLRELEGEAQND